MKYIILALFFISCHTETKKSENMWTFQDKLDAASNCKKPQRDSLQVIKDSLEVKIEKLIDKYKNNDDLTKWKFEDLTSYQDFNRKIIYLDIEQIEFMRQEGDSIQAVK